MSDMLLKPMCSGMGLLAEVDLCFGWVEGVRVVGRLWVLARLLGSWDVEVGSGRVRVVLEATVVGLELGMLGFVGQVEVLSEEVVRAAMGVAVGDLGGAASVVAKGSKVNVELLGREVQQVDVAVG